MKSVARLLPFCVLCLLIIPAAGHARDGQEVTPRAQRCPL